MPHCQHEDQDSALFDLVDDPIVAHPNSILRAVAQGKTCATCGAELQGFVADHVKCSACGETRFYCGLESAQLPGRPDLRCFACDAPIGV